MAVVHEQRQSWFLCRTKMTEKVRLYTLVLFCMLPSMVSIFPLFTIYWVRQDNLNGLKELSLSPQRKYAQTLTLLGFSARAPQPPAHSGLCHHVQAQRYPD